MARPNATKITRSTGNVFRDIGFRSEEAEHLLIRADLLIQLQKLVASRGLKQGETAKILKVSQPRVSDLLRGRIDLFSTDTLIDMLARLSVRVRLVLMPSDSKGSASVQQIRSPDGSDFIGSSASRASGEGVT